MVKPIILNTIFIDLGEHIIIKIGIFFFFFVFDITFVCHYSNLIILKVYMYSYQDY